MNTLPATISEIVVSGHLSSLRATVNDDSFTLLLAEPMRENTGKSVTLAFKETEVILSKEPIRSTANAMQAQISRIDHGSILTQVILEYAGKTITALVPTLMFECLEILEGEHVYWMVQPSEISLLWGQP